MMRFELKVALRFLKEGKGQSAFILMGIAVGVAVMVFLNTLITGLQKDLIDQTVGSSAHIWIEGQSAFEQQLDRMSSRNVIAGNTDKRQILLDGWEDMLDVVRDQEDIVTAAPIVQGSGYMIGSKENVPVFVNGSDPNREMTFTVIPRRWSMARR